jgi:hypothetical protein
MRKQDSFVFRDLIYGDGGFCLARKRDIFFLPETRASTWWSEEEMGVLRSHYHDHENLELAARFGRTVESVKRKATQLGLYKANGRPDLRKNNRASV